MTKTELYELGEMYCKTRPGSCVMDVNTEANTIITYYHGAILTSDAAKVKEMLGVEDESTKIA